MNYLELCRFTRKECGISYTGTTPTPTTTVNQTGILGKIVDNVWQAWVELQAIHPDWRFLHAVKVQALTINVRTYNLISALALQYLREFDRAGCFIEETSADKTPLTYEDWEDFRFRIISTTGGRPKVFTVNLDGEVEFDVPPDKAYTVRLAHWLMPERLDDDADVPAIHEDLHEVIGWQAVIRYAGNNTSGPLYQHAYAQRNEFLSRMELRYLPLPTDAKYVAPGLR